MSTDDTIKEVHEAWVAYCNVTTPKEAHTAYERMDAAIKSLVARHTQYNPAAGRILDKVCPSCTAYVGSVAEHWANTRGLIGSGRWMCARVGTVEVSIPNEWKARPLTLELVEGDRERTD